jgi:asparagine synthase (glutamine-hydrolysing)
LQEFISTTLKLQYYYEENIINKYPINIETEKLYYRKIFNSYYPHCNKLLPYFWMPRYTNACDPSARTLELYYEKDASKSNDICSVKINPMYYYVA